ncbi:transposase [Methylocystis sp. JR02]|uniref:REP-associated tyrosine transposase n=1 Tax=Methylocystis sp. JR02 TaxID=3046284 RepID=UPI0024BACF8B|nr:transposase [Methylocystis sp. JR02]MDJ0447760.1 transposase [Methylocystis sp. JR02]
MVDALPASVDRRRETIDAALDRCRGPLPLADPQAAIIVQGAILHFDQVRYRLLAWCVMPNHVHVVVEAFAGFPLGGLVRSWKAFSAAQINRANGRRGAVWAPDYFDRYIRDESDLGATISYVENNPVVAGLASTPGDWPWSSASVMRA